MSHIAQVSAYSSEDIKSCHSPASTIHFNMEMGVGGIHMKPEHNRFTQSFSWGGGGHSFYIIEMATFKVKIA